MNDELFFAWLDGELDDRQAAEVEARVAEDPELRRRAEADRALGARIHSAFDAVVETPVPDALLAAARSSRHEVIDLAAARSRRERRPIANWPQWAAMAATLAIGIVAGTMIGGGATGPVASEDGRLVASSELEQALSTRLASAPADDGPRIGLTFRDSAGNLCRSFTDQTSSGLACRQRGDWRIRGLFQAPDGQQGEFRMAAGTDPRLAELVDSTIAGEPLDAAAEKRAIERLR